MMISKTKRTMGIFLFVPLILLIVISFLSSTPMVTSYELTTRISETEEQTRIDYIDSDGKIMFASDKGYASQIRTFQGGRLILDEYFNASGKPVTLPTGYSKIKRFYDDGMNTVIMFLSTSSQPRVISKGYDSIHRSYDDDGNPYIDTFYVGDTQVVHEQGYWQYQLFYTDDKICEIRYLDKEGNLILSKDGYAIIKRSYTDDCKTDMYFDTLGNPVKSALGVYGTKSMDDMTVYLDAVGNPQNTVRGYAFVKKEGSKALYYDLTGNPVTIGRKQYGINIKSGQNVYLDIDGKTMIRFDNILNTHPRLVLIGGIVLTITALVLKGSYKKIYIGVCLLLVAYMTLAYRETGASRSQFTLFWSYSDFITSPITRQNILNNIWLFVPLGAAVYDRKQPYKIILCILISIIIETIQLLTGMGLCEIDDVISNGLGAAIGFASAYAGDLLKA